ncbi:bifunctional helix-turn-helix transcriptional regulator/GNAT family N-acetyltransferase [Sphingobacterium sp. Mn56C]|uniref:bifunctional helix-turn-helix transcriptional regulator/GNAT family N-acetyltransferase n=1 Tax=Sphingobacterium sp. Mn56C TaxID=3395261 RepID=UPI003BDC4883
MDFFNRTGKMALGSRLRLLTAKFTDDAVKIYDLYNSNVSVKWFPVLFVLSDGSEKTITEIADEIGHSQPSVTKLTKEMAKAGLLNNNLKTSDKRRNMVSLSEDGQSVIDHIIQVQGIDVEAAIDGLIREANHNLWEAIAEWEFLLEQKSLFRRVQEQKKDRESKNVQIVPYSAMYQSAFKALNEEWISTYFEMEEADHKALDNPEDYILNKGGKILVALYQGEPVGVCALIKMENAPFDYEMAKMAVSPKVQGKSIGFLLGTAITDLATELGAAKIFLESNTVLKPAINLYHKLGFQKISGFPSPYKRCNIQMELNLPK